MFVVKNAWKSVTRNKGRNMLIIVIVTIIAAAATCVTSARNRRSLPRWLSQRNSPASGCTEAGPPRPVQPGRRAGSRPAMASQLA